MLNLVGLLHHDICDSLMDYVTLETVMTLRMVAKGIPDLVEHRKIENAFINSATNERYFFSKFKHSDQLIKRIYNHQIIMREVFVRGNIMGEKIIYYSRCEYDIVKVFSTVISGDLSYVYFCLFANNCDQYIKLKKIANLFIKNGMTDKYERFRNCASTIMKKKKLRLDNKTSWIPWLMIGLIADDKDVVKRIFELYHQCPYYYEMHDIGGTWCIVASSQLDTYFFLRDYIAMIYPELSELFELVKLKDQQMSSVINPDFKVGI